MTTILYPVFGRAGEAAPRPKPEAPCEIIIFPGVRLNRSAEKDAPQMTEFSLPAQIAGEGFPT